MNVVSERLNCNASACILIASSDSLVSKTHSGLPLKGLFPCVKTFTIRYERDGICVGSMSRQFSYIQTSLIIPCTLMFGSPLRLPHDNGRGRNGFRDCS